MKWTITYRAVLHSAVAENRADALREELAGLSTAHPGRLVQVPDACEGTLLAGEVAVCEDFGYPEVERLLARLSDLESTFPEVKVEARDSLGLVGRDPSTRRLNVRLVASDGFDEFDDEMNDPFDMAVDSMFGDESWPIDDLEFAPFNASMWESYDLAAPKRVSVRSEHGDDGLWDGELTVDARRDSSGAGAVLLVQGDLRLRSQAERAHVVTCEVIVRSDSGRVLGSHCEGFGIDVHRSFEVHLEVGLDTAELEDMATIEIWMDSYLRRRHVLARWNPPTELVIDPVPGVEATLDLRCSKWPVPGLKLVGEVVSKSDRLITAMDLAFVARDRHGRILDDDETELGLFMPGDTRPLEMQLNWDYDNSEAVGGAVHAALVSRERTRSWCGHVVRLSLVDQ